jgi:putative SbcD/Mre11-related phosphoesterase
LIRIIPEEPALLVRRCGERVLVVADMHLGIEGELAGSGISLPSQTPKLRRRITGLVERSGADRLILLGDIKHGIPAASWQEWREIPRLLGELARMVRVEIVPGNHDGDIEGMVPKGVILHSVRGVAIGRTAGLWHGHAWPSPEVAGCRVIIMGHNHPAVEIRDMYGGRVVEPVWLKMRVNRSKLPEELRGGRCESLIVMPAFGELVGGAPVNRSIPDELMGPILRSGAINLERAEVYLLDGTFLGRVGELRRLGGGI